MKTNLLITTLGILTLFSCAKKSEDPQPAIQQTQAAPNQPGTSVEPKDTAEVEPVDTLSNKVKFTIYGSKTPYMWRRYTLKGWKDTYVNRKDTIFYEDYIPEYPEYRYYATFNASGKLGDSLSVKAEYKGKTALKTTQNGVNNTMADIQLKNLK